MDINDISVNYLIKNAGQFEHFTWRNTSMFTCQCETGFGAIWVDVEMGAQDRNIYVRDADSCTFITFRRVQPKLFETFLDALNWNFEDEEGEAA